jgi:hypothetical protein
MEHILWDCTRSRTLWLQFENWWNNTVNIQCPAVSCKTIFVGSFSNLPSETLYNHVILLIKYYMFQNKEKQFLFGNLLNIFEQTAKTEKYISKKITV